MSVIDALVDELFISPYPYHDPAQPAKAVFKLLYLALNNASKKWTMPIQNWKQAMQQFAIMFDGRVPIS